MPLRQLKPFIPSGPDFARAKAFFQDLGFELRWEVPGLAELALGDVVFLLQDFHNQTMQDNLMMFVAVDDLDRWWQRIVDSGVLQYEGVRAKEPTDYPWGQREIHLVDPSGVCWHFA
ncbi:MAG TPA: VOC family protein [Burkholderiaceae bacterium]|nr:VOC family protein [Burkholderiaceae bacterium]